MAGDGKIEEVHDVAEADPVHEIADRPSQDEGEADLEPHALVRGTERIGRHDDEDQHRHAVQDHRLDRGIDRSEEAERGAAVSHVGQVEEASDDGARLVNVERARDDPLGPLIEKQDREGDEEVGGPVDRALLDPGKLAHAALPIGGYPRLFRTSRQRTQRPVSCASGVTFQQRSHRRPGAFSKRSERPG